MNFVELDYKAVHSGSAAAPSVSVAADASSSRAQLHTQWPDQLDITFADAPVELHCIAFANYYTATITVLHSQTAPSSRSVGPWTTVVSKLQLMTDPHLEDDAQAQHEIFCRHFERDFNWREVYFLRIIRTQPSPLWKRHSLRDLRFFSARSAPPAGMPSGALQQREGAEKSTKRAEALSTELVALLQVAHQIHNTLAEASPVGRRETERGQLYLVGEWEDELRL
uniref:Uncharacterized protein n=1 Tax=Coccolithus braarudii TaxID=221442 RepID=A0A7S0L245_9EUKA|mmetsp:Transcript_1494/g.3206  ORF Transcript_1494/g.3206 Transcript_1494/m.3206 type:complete len:225 (+) Transcript_1494:153-827(+)